MIAKNNETLQEASETLYSMHCEETIRGMARARQDYHRLHNYLDHKIATLEADNEQLTSDVAKLSSALSDRDAEIAAQADEIASLKAQIQKLTNEK